MDVPLVYEDTLLRAIVKGEDGYDVTLKAGKEPFLDSMEAAVPGCRDSVKAFLDLIEPIDAAQTDMNENGLNPIKLFKEHGDFLRAASHSGLALARHASSASCMFPGMDTPASSHLPRAA